MGEATQDTLSDTQSDSKGAKPVGGYARTIAILRDVVEQSYEDGFVLAGNFAYLSLLAIFPFFIVAAAVAGAFGRTEYGYEAVEAFLVTLPPSVARALSEPVQSALTARTGALLWFSVAVGLWTTASLIETIRDIIRRAYKVLNLRPFWHYRLGAILATIITVLVTMLAFSAQVMLQGAQQFIDRLIPFASSALSVIAFSQLATTLLLFGALYLMFRTMTPREFRQRKSPIWPGPLLIALFWMGLVALLPVFLTNFANYDLTYGSLAGVMISLIFFFLIGLAMVTGAELNAALARHRPSDEAD
ncbi:YihY/virulence factor BrkB family protein [Parasphingorhabdus sp. DH2-15]|uniref:YihY/virulence factor BrkB family protein n=1 Tax=Parasphingorhabdus sp. DH2-15 TaxID=3444112 RepID=UPI003F685050